MVSRRALIGRLAVGAAGAAVAWSAKVPVAQALGVPEAGQKLPESAPNLVPVDDVRVSHAEVESPLAAADESLPAPWELLRPLAQGSTVAEGWTVAELSPVAEGSFVVTLRNDLGREQRVHVCRNEGRPQGLVHTDAFDLVVMNGGRGDLPTEEGMAQAVAEVAHVLAANEALHRHRAVQVALLSHGDRLERLSDALGGALR